MEDETTDAEMWKSHAEAKKQQHLKWHTENKLIIVNSGFNFEDKKEALLFRGIISADFYPSTGRWKYKQKIYSGGAERFIKFLKTRGFKA